METRRPIRQRLRRAGIVVAAMVAVVVAAFLVSPANAQTDVCDQTLQEGDTGQCVEALQTRLNELGLSDPLIVDGEFGSGTRNAVEAFQGRSNIAVDGVVGPDTIGHLREPGDVTLAYESTAEVDAMIREVFPDDIEDKAVEVASCESGLVPIAIGRNTNGSRDYGVFQFNDGGTLQEYMPDTATALTARPNIEAALALYNERGWQPWYCA